MSRNLELLEQVQQDRELFGAASLGKRTTECTEVRGVDQQVVKAEFNQEELITLAQRLFLSTPHECGSHVRLVVFSGVEDANGTSALCAQLARILASQVRGHVCVVDADVRTPILHRHFEEKPANSVAFESNPGQPQLKQVASNLWLLSGCRVALNEGVTASLERIQLGIESLPAEFEYVVINAAPIGLYSDAVLRGQKADGAVLVLEANSTRRASARAVKQALDRANIRLLGTVLNNRTFPIPETFYALL